MKRYWTALLAILVSALLYKLTLQFVPGNLKWLISFIRLSLMVGIGYFLSPTTKRNNRWLGKVVISIIVVLIFGMQLDIINTYEFKDILNLVGLNGVFLDIVLIYCGWAFFQV